MIRNVLSRLIGMATALSALALVLMMLHIFVDVIAKYVFSVSLPGTIAIVSNYYMVAVIFLPLALAEKNSRHISVEILVEKLSYPIQARLNGLAAVYSTLIFGLMAWRGTLEALRKTEVQTFIIEHQTRIDTWPAYYLLPWGTGLLAIALIYKLVRYLRLGTSQNVLQPF